MQISSWSLMSYLRHFTPLTSPMKFTVRSSFFRLSSPSRFSITSILFNARFRYSSLFSKFRFSIFATRLFCIKRILRYLQWWLSDSILSMFSWWRDISSRVDISPSLCSARFLMRSRVRRTIFSSRFHCESLCQLCEALGLSLPYLTSKYRFNSVQQPGVNSRDSE